MASELVSDTFGGTDTDIVINNVYNVGIPPTFKSDGIRIGDSSIAGDLTASGNLLVSGSTSGSIAVIGTSGSVHINQLGSGSISASGFLFAKLENINDSSLRPVIYDPIIGKFFTTGSAIGGGGSVVISTVSDTAGQTGIDFTLSSGDLSAVASGLDTDDDVAFAQVSASGNLFANLPDGFQNVATYNSQSGQLFFTSSAGLFSQLDTFRSLGQRTGSAIISGSLEVLGEVSASNTGSFKYLVVNPTNLGDLTPTFDINLGYTLGEFIGDKESIIIRNTYSDGDYYIGNSAFKNGHVYRDNAGGVITLFNGNLGVQTTTEGTYIQKPASNFGTTGNIFAGTGNALQVEGRISSSGDLVVNQGDFQTIQGHVTASGAISASGHLFASASLGFQNIATYNSESGQFFFTSSEGLSSNLDTFKTTGQRTGDASITGSLTITGTITAQEFHTEFVSSSIIFESGSTIFGNSADDTHTFSGSITASHNISASGHLFASASLGFQNIATYNSESGEFFYTSSAGLASSLDTFKTTGQRDGDSGITGSLVVAGNISASGRINLNPGSSNTAGHGLRFRDRTDLGLFEHSFDLGIMAPDSVQIHIDSNDNDDDTRHFSIVKNHSTIADQTGLIFKVREDATVSIYSHLSASGNISASGELFISASEANFSDVLVYSGIDGNGKVHFTSSAGLASGLDTFKTTGQRDGDSAITGSLVVIGNISASGNITASDILIPTGKIEFKNSSATTVLDLNNNNIVGVNRLFFNDPGNEEGIIFDNIKIFESPDDLSNTAGNLQIEHSNNRILTVHDNGIEVTGSGHITASGNIQAAGQISASGHLFASASLGFQNIATYNSESGQFFYTSSAGLASGLDTFKTTGVRTGDGFIDGDITGSNRLLIQKSNGQGDPSAGTSDVAIFQNNDNNQDASIAIIAADTKKSQLHFGHSSSINVGGIRYFHKNHSTSPDQLHLRVNGGIAGIFSPVLTSKRGLRLGGDGNIPSNGSDILSIQGALGGNGLTISSSAGTRIKFIRGANGNQQLFEYFTGATRNWSLGNAGESDDNFYIYNTDSDVKFIELVNEGNSTHIHTNVTASGAISASSTLHAGLSEAQQNKIVYYDTNSGELTFDDIAKALDAAGLLSSSFQIESDISGAFTNASSSIATDIATNTTNIATNTSAINTLNTSGIISASSLSSPAQGEVQLTINGVSQTVVDLGLQTTDNVQFGDITTLGNTTLGNSILDTHTFGGHITASGDISASGNIIIGGNITASGNISASGHLFASASLNNNTNLKTVVYNTQSGEFFHTTLNPGDAVVSIHSSNNNTLTIDNTDPTQPVITAVTAVVSSGSLNLTTGDNVYNFVNALTSSFLTSSPFTAAGISGSWQGQNFFNNINQFVGTAAFSTAITGAFTNISNSIATDIVTNSENISTNTTNINNLLASTLISESSLSSPAQGEAQLTINGVAQSAVDLGLQTTDNVTFASVNSPTIITEVISSSTNLILNSDTDNNSGGNFDNIIFQTKGSERMRISGSGRVGIGTALPDKKLVVAPGVDGNADISASGDIYGNTFIAANHITASGDISASGKIFGGLTSQNHTNVVYYDTTTGELTQDTAVKLLDAAGIISSSAQIATDISGAFESVSSSLSASIATNTTNLSSITTTVNNNTVAINNLPNAASISGSFLLNTTDTLAGTLTVTNDIDLTNASSKLFFNNNSVGTRGITYKDSGNGERLGLIFPGSDLVVLANRASNGVVQIRANTSTAGSGGEVTVAEFQDDKVIINTDLSASGNLFADVADSSDTGFKTVMINPTTGKFFRTGSYGGSSVAVDTFKSTGIRDGNSEITGSLTLTNDTNPALIITDTSNPEQISITQANKQATIDLTGGSGQLNDLAITTDHRTNHIFVNGDTGDILLGGHIEVKGGGAGVNSAANVVATGYIEASGSLIAGGLLFASASEGNFSDIVVHDSTTNRFYVTSSAGLSEGLDTFKTTGIRTGNGFIDGHLTASGQLVLDDGNIRSGNNFDFLTLGGSAQQINVGKIGMSASYAGANTALGAMSTTNAAVFGGDVAIGPHNNGKLGVGTLTPDHILNVVGDNNTTAVGIDIGSDAKFDFAANSTSGYTTTFNMDNTGLDIGHNSAARALNLKTDSTDRLTILGGGNVGINTTSPAEKLEIHSGSLQIDTTGEGIKFGGTGAPSTNRIKFTTANNLQFDFDGKVQFVGTDADITAGADLMLRNADSNNIIRLTNEAASGTSADEGRLDIKSNTTTKVSITGSKDGRIGIGTTTPKKALHIENSGILIDGGSALDGTGFNERFIIDTGASTSHTFLQFKNDNGGQLTVTGAGNVSASGNLFADVTDSSDTNFKTVMYDTVTGQFFRTGSYGGGAGGGGTVTSVTSATIGQLTVANTTSTPAISIVTGAVVDGGTALATGNQIFDFVDAQGFVDKVRFSNLNVGSTQVDDDGGGTAEFNMSGSKGVLVRGGTNTLGIELDYFGTDNFIDVATNLEGTSIATGDTIVYHDETDNNVKKGFISDLPFTNNAGTVTSVGVGTGLDITNASTTPNITLDLTELTLGSGLDSTATGLTLDLSEFSSTSTFVSTDEFIVLDNNAERKIEAGDIPISAFNNDAGFGTVITVAGGTNISISGTSISPTVNFAPAGVAHGVYFNGGTGGIMGTPSSGFLFDEDNADELKVAGDIIAFASDKRLKENIVEIPDPIEKIKKLRGVYYDWKDKALDLGFQGANLRQHNEIGLIAQELEEVIPQAVTRAPFDNENNKKIYLSGNRIDGETEPYKTIKMDKVVPLLIEAIKDQQKQIDELKKLVKNAK